MADPWPPARLRRVDLKAIDAALKLAVLETWDEKVRGERPDFEAAQERIGAILASRERYYGGMP